MQLSSAIHIRKTIDNPNIRIEIKLKLILLTYSACPSQVRKYQECVLLFGRDEVVGQDVVLLSGAPGGMAAVKLVQWWKWFHGNAGGIGV